MLIYDVPQRSAEWWEIKAGIPSAGSFARFLTPLGKLSNSDKTEKYINELISERIAGKADGGYVSPAMQFGIDMEPQARKWYAHETKRTVYEVGFITTDDGHCGCSPDGLVGDEGGLEAKVPELHTHIEYLRKQEMPDKYKLQVHGCLAVTERDWWDWVSYSPSGVKNLIVRVEPDRFTRLVRSEVERFHERYMAAWREIEKGYKPVTPVF